MDDTHIFRAYVGGRGYSLFVGNRSQGFVRQPMDIATDAIPRSYQSSQSMLDEKIGPKIPWAVCACHKNYDSAPILAYGCRWDTGDPKLGFLRFSHAIQLRNLADVASSLSNILVVLRVRWPSELTQMFSRLANGKARNLESVLSYLSSCIESLQSSRRRVDALLSQGFQEGSTGLRPSLRSDPRPIGGWHWAMSVDAFGRIESMFAGTVDQPRFPMYIAMKSAIDVVVDATRSANTPFGSNKTGSDSLI